jgi:hypothetical protein
MMLSASAAKRLMVASPSQMGRLETRWLTVEMNLLALAFRQVDRHG